MNIKKQAGSFDAYKMDLSFAELKSIEQALAVAQESSMDPEPDPIRDVLLQGIRWYWERLPVPGEDEDTAEEKAKKGEPVDGEEDLSLPEPGAEPGVPPSPEGDEDADVPPAGDEESPFPHEDEYAEAGAPSAARESLEPKDNDDEFSLPDPLAEGRRDSVGTHRTVVTDDPAGELAVYYHDTKVVSFNRQTGDVTLDTGGYHTPTTMRRMNQAAQQYRLGFKVYKKGGQTYVDVHGQAIPFEGDTIEFNRTGPKQASEPAPEEGEDALPDPESDRPQERPSRRGEHPHYWHRPEKGMPAV